MTFNRILPAVLAAAFLLFSGPVQAEIKKEWFDYTHDTKKLKAFVVHDDAKPGKRPAILMLHARDGMSAKTQELAEIWARFGYLVFAADIFGYGEGILPKDVKEMAVQTGIYRKDPALARARTKAGYDALLRHPLADASKIATIGYCFGGDLGVEFSTGGAPLALHVAIHGSFGKYPPGWAKTVKGRFLILHGAEDTGYPMPAVTAVMDELRAAKVPFQVEIYSGTGHGFSSPKNEHEERSNAQSIASTERTLKDVFGL